MRVVGCHQAIQKVLFDTGYKYSILLMVAEGVVAGYRGVTGLLMWLQLGVFWLW